MPTTQLALTPGVDTQSTRIQNKARISSCNLIRYQNKRLQKLGGCTRLTNETIRGTGRALHAFQDLSAIDYIGIGTSAALELYTRQAIIDITPINHTSNLSAPFDTVAGSTTVTVHDASWAPATGDAVEIVTAVYVDGIVLQGTYTITGTGVNTYTITATTPALVGVIGGGVVATYETTNGSELVQVTLGTYTFINLQNFTVGVSLTIATIPLFGVYQVTLSGSNAFITGSVTANADAGPTSENGSNVRIVYPITLPPENVSAGAFGGGTFGTGLFGVGTGGSGAPTINLWALDNWGQDLVACLRGGAIYVWIPPIATGNYAAVISGAPAAANGIFVAMPEQQLVAWGAYSAGVGAQDPLLLAWSDISDYTTWTASATNQAGTFRIPNGSRIVAVVQMASQSIILTDLEAWSMQYVGFPLVYGFNKIATGCGLISPNAVAKIGNMLIWMSQKGFFVYDGQSVRPIPCDVWDIVYNSTATDSTPIDTNYVDEVFAAPNSQFNEVGFYIPTQGSGGLITTYVKLNVVDGTWDYGQNQLVRTSWMDQSVVGGPIGTDYNGLLQQHETALDFDGQVFDCWGQTGYFELQQGGLYIYLDRIIPDFILNTDGQVQITFYVVNYPTDTPRVYGPYPVTSATKYLVIRARGRFASYKIESIAANTFWRNGDHLVVISPAGSR